MHALKPDLHGPHAAAPKAPRSTATSSGPVLALDLGGTYIRTAVVLSDGSLRAVHKERTPLAEGAETVLAATIVSLRRSLEEHLRAGGVPAVAVGISAPGPLNTRTGLLVDPPNLGSSFWGLAIGPRIGQALGLPVALERDTHVAILAERAFGAGTGLDDLVYLTISTGVGGAVITGGRLMTGPDGVAGELGHLTVDMDGPICSCGGRGHLERLSSGSGMVMSARDALAAGADAPELARIAAEVSPRSLEAVHISHAADAGDQVARQIVERARRAFAASLVSIVDIFEPARVIVGGGIVEAWGDDLLQPARDLVAQTAFRVAAQRVEIVPAQLGADVGLIGALPLVRLALAGDLTTGVPTPSSAPS
jgi:glucokinase